MRNSSLSLRLVVCMVISLVLNAFIGQHLKSTFSQEAYTVSVDARYGTDATMELMYDTGIDFNLKQRVSKPLKKGNNLPEFHFKLQKGEQLRYIRLDFGADTVLKSVELNTLTLASQGKVLFQLHKDEIARKIGLVKGVSKVDKTSATFELNGREEPFRSLYRF